MIHPNLIKRKADEDRLAAPAVERDYVLAHALSAISRHDERAQIVFKGGTALRLCHFDRDLYDLHELLAARGVDARAVWPAFERKARHRGFDSDRFAERFGDRVPEWARRWDAELMEYVTPAPHFDAVLRAVRRELRFALGSSAY